MSNSNQQTIQAYETHVQEYIDGTPQEVVGVMKEWLEAALADLPPDARILELGSGFGRDASYLQDRGFTVQCTDATQAFVDLLQKRGFPVRLLNAITDDLGGPYDLILATAVLLHFSRDETKKVLQKVFDALNPGGRFAFTLKQGEGEKWVDGKLGAPRYFCFWTEKQIRPLVESAGFTEVSISDNRATAHATWLQIIARKQS